ncbi:TetR/AcrR family transcriptional regulator [Bacteroidia bacterium]|jgi:TetR/AcrR family transcriptional regulator, transcriptional repressor for nem operon|nr:TetR/AcrR family transcriptional regulator [Bacteroidia bacterium]
MPRNTRDIILDKCFEALSVNGFVALRTDHEIKALNITKGAFYHYFSSKSQLGVALVKERIKPFYDNLWSSILSDPKNIKENYIEMINQEKRRVGDHGIHDVMCIMCTESNRYDTLLIEAFMEFMDEFIMRLQAAIRQAKSLGKVVQSGDSKSQAHHLLNGTMSCYLIPSMKKSVSLFTASTNALIKNLEASFFNDHVEALPFA